MARGAAHRTGPQRHPSARAIALAGLAALAVAMGIGRFAFTPILPIMQAEIGLSTAQGAWLATANYAGYLVGSLGAVWLRSRATTVIALGLLVIAATTGAMAWTNALHAWMLLRFLAGVASAGVLVHVSSWTLSHLHARSRGALGGVVYAGVGIGIAIAGLACLATMQAHAGYREAWLGLGALALLICALLYLPLRTTRHADVVAHASGFTIRRAGRGFWSLVLCYGAFGFGYIIPATFLPAMARAVVPDPAVFGWAWPIFGIAAASSTLLASRLASAISPRALWSGASIVMAVGVIVPVLTDGASGIVLSALAVGGTFMVITLAGMQEARRVGGAHATTYMAAMTSAFAAGQVLGPVVLGALVRAPHGFAYAAFAGSALLVASALVLTRDATSRQTTNGRDGIESMER
jgi:predicted MFS family arabinose efflux permease